jgi:hypothetical protein
MNLHDLTVKFLTDNGYDGLYKPTGECFCFVEELMPCGEPWPICEVGYRYSKPCISAKKDDTNGN